MASQPLPTNDAYSAMGQATSTASIYLSDAITSIDNALGKGYATKHPELIGAFMQSAASDYNAWMLGICTEHICESLDRIDIQGVN